MTLQISPLHDQGIGDSAYYRDPKARAAYAQMIRRIFGALYNVSAANDTGALFSPDITNAEAVVELEAKLDAARSQAKYTSNSATVQTIQELDDLAPELSMSYQILVLSSARMPDRVTVSSASYLKSTSQILREVDSLTITSYLSWKLIQRYILSIEHNISTRFRGFQRKMAGQDPNVVKERWRSCVQYVGEELGAKPLRHPPKPSFNLLMAYTLEEMVSPIYASLAHLDTSYAHQIVTDIVEELSQKIRHADWMSEQVKQLSLEKASQIRHHYGYSDGPSTSHTMSQCLSDAEISNGHFANLLCLRKYQVTRSWARLNQPADRDSWHRAAFST